MSSVNVAVTTFGEKSLVNDIGLGPKRFLEVRGTSCLLFEIGPIEN